MSFDFDRVPTQQEKIIAALKDAGAEGVTNVDLAKICLRYGARISELYKKGYGINILKTEKKGVFKYVLMKTPSGEEYFNNAQIEVLNTIEREYSGGISTTELLELLHEKNFHIIRKPNWFKERN